MCAHGVRTWMHRGGSSEVWRMSAKNVDTEVEMTIHPAGSAEGAITVRGQTALHEDPAKVRQLLDLLGMPQGTEVRVTTKASSVIVR